MPPRRPGSGRRTIHFEGAYTNDFAGHPHKTPRYNYNQVLYRFDLDAPPLAAARAKRRPCLSVLANGSPSAIVERLVVRSRRDPAATRRRWAERLGRFDTSALTVAEFCAAEGVSVPAFYQWKRVLAAGDGPLSPATAGTARLVLLTDDDLLDQYPAARPGLRLTAVRIGTAARLARVLDRLPKEVTHITFDPQPKFHRRFPLTALRERLPDATV